jgi:anti-anti-sigma regulatory factor
VKKLLQVVMLAGVTVSDKGGTMNHKVEIPEEFYIANVSAVAGKILLALQCEQDVVLDLSGVTRIDSAALQAMLSARMEAERLGVRLTFQLSGLVRSVTSALGISL